MGVSFTVAGALELARDGAVISDRAFGGPQPRLVAAMLLVDRDRAWSPEQIAAQVWPSGPPERWRPAVRLLVSRLRGLLAEVGVDERAVESRSGHYHVDLPDLAVDLEVAGDDVVRAAQALADGRLDAADDLAARARAVLSRPILPGLEAPWVEELRRTVGPDHVESLLVLGRVRRRQGRWSAARSVLAEVLGRAPFREDAWRDLMGLEAESGNVAAALQVYEDCRRQLADELGVDPSPATQELHTAILRSVPTPAPVRDAEVAMPPAHALSAGPDTPDGGPGVTVQRPPYVGLRAFEHGDAELFFGRDAAVQRLVDLLADHPTATVVGPSGSGKSSLVRAGLLPALASGAIPDADTWPVVVVVPGRRPLAALAAALVARGRGGCRTGLRGDRHGNRHAHCHGNGHGHRHRHRRGPGGPAGRRPRGPRRHGAPDPGVVGGRPGSADPGGRRPGGGAVHGQRVGPVRRLPGGRRRGRAGPCPQGRGRGHHACRLLSPGRVEPGHGSAPWPLAAGDSADVGRRARGSHRRTGQPGGRDARTWHRRSHGRRGDRTARSAPPAPAHARGSCGTTARGPS